MPPSPVVKRTSRRTLGPTETSLGQLVLATSPIFALLCYFLYLTANRHNLAAYNLDGVDDDAAVQELIASDGPVLELGSILDAFLGFFFCWSCALVYVAVFIPKRRLLVDEYVTRGLIVLGDVKYSPRRGWRYLCTSWKRFAAEYAVVTYRHGTALKVTGGGSGGGSGATSEGRWVVSKLVRTFHPYSRENVALWVIPGRPMSAQPKADVEHDFATFAGTDRDRSRGVVVVLLAWTAFTLCGSLYVCLQMEKLEEKDPQNIDSDLAWKLFFFAVCGLTPLVAVGGNWVRWLFYKRWMTGGGHLVEMGSAEEQVDRPGLEDEQPGYGGDCGGLIPNDDDDYSSAVTPYQEMEMV